MVIQSSESELRDVLSVTPDVEKWGWVIYRCTYTDDATWNKFRDYIEASTRRSIAESDAPEIAERMEWTWVEDASTLDEASTPALRERFHAWVADEEARHPGNYGLYRPARLSYFIKVDQEALDSLVGPLSRDMSYMDEGFVKFVDADWKPLAEQEDEPQTEWEKEFFEEFGGIEDDYEPIEGCTEKDVGWMRINPCSIYASLYLCLDCSMDPVWNLFYVRPPEIMIY